MRQCKVKSTYSVFRESSVPTGHHHLAGHDQCGPSSDAEYDENDRATDVPEVQGAARTTGWLMMMPRIIEQYILNMLFGKTAEGEGGHEKNKAKLISGKTEWRFFRQN